MGGWKWQSRVLVPSYRARPSQGPEEESDMTGPWQGNQASWRDGRGIATKVS